MNICLLNDSFPPLIDGVATAVVNYAKNLTAHGHSASVVTPEYPGADDSAYGYPVYRYPGVDLRKWVGYVAGWPFSPVIERELKESRVELLHSHCPVSSTVLARSIARPLDVPVVLTYHTKFDIEIAKLAKSKLVQEGAIRAMTDNISACDDVWVVSRGAGENLRSLGYKGEYTVMPNGVDFERGRASEAEIREATAGYGLPAGVPVYLFVGRMMWYKGLKIIIDALAALKSQNYDFRMVFIGGGGDEKEVRAYVSKAGLDGKTVFTGKIYDRRKLVAWYSRADLFLFPSTFDTNGLVVREAAACSLPSVLIKDSCAAEDSTHLKNSFLIEENAASMAVCLASLIEHPERLSYVKENCADDLYLSWEDAVKNAEKRYEYVIERFRDGGFRRHRRPSDEFFRFTGELMDIMSDSFLNDGV
ncbi:MAG: glycosyltransferase [Clostridia bacterium]|nr:glycosyltransferase [Clostridia bacterium]